MKFEDLNVEKRILEVLKAQQITEPTEIQSKTYPLAANGHELIGVSETGSGKTLAFVLPLVSQILHCNNKPFHSLIIVPTREIARQVTDVVGIFSGLGIRCTALVGGEGLNTQAKAISERPHIVVGTPGSIESHINKTKSFKIEKVRKLVLDEADRFFEGDFLDSLDFISKSLKSINQVLMFTATLTEKTKKLSQIFMKSASPKIVEAGSKTKLDRIEEVFYLIPEKYKIAALVNLLKRIESASVIIFVSMCAVSERLSLLLSKVGISCGVLNGNMSQERRECVMGRFRSGGFQALVSTDLAARGLDVPEVGYVINYDIPNTAKSYIHRIGRTARAGRQGKAITFVTQYTLGIFQRVEHGLKRKISKEEFDDYSNSQNLVSLYNELKSEYNSETKRRKK